MSTLSVSNISDGTTTVGASYVVNGSAKAWVNFNGTGTIAARDSLNVSSLTDIGTGQYDVNPSNAFGSTSVAISGALGDDNAANSGLRNLNAFIPSSSASAFRIHSSTVSITSNRTSIDDPYTMVAIHGDLA